MLLIAIGWKYGIRLLSKAFNSSSFKPPAIVPISCNTEPFQLVAVPNTDSVIFLNCFRTGVLHSKRPILATAALNSAVLMDMISVEFRAQRIAPNPTKSKLFSVLIVCPESSRKLRKIDLA